MADRCSLWLFLDPTQSQRKGKIVIFYEVEITLDWSGVTADGEKCDGTASIPNLSDENDPEDLEVSFLAILLLSSSRGGLLAMAHLYFSSLFQLDVTMKTKDTPALHKIKDIVRRKGLEVVQQQCARWLKDLKEKYCANMVKPTKTTSGSSIGSQPKAAAAGTAQPVKILSQAPTQAASAASVVYKSYNLEDKFNCTPQDLWNGLLVPEVCEHANRLPRSPLPPFLSFYTSFDGSRVPVSPPESRPSRWCWSTRGCRLQSRVALLLQGERDEAVMPCCGVQSLLAHRRETHLVMWQRIFHTLGGYHSLMMTRRGKPYGCTFLYLSWTHSCV